MSDFEDPSGSPLNSVSNPLRQLWDQGSEHARTAVQGLGRATKAVGGYALQAGKTTVACGYLLTEAAAGVSLFGLKKAYDAGSWVVDKQVGVVKTMAKGAEVVGEKLFPVQTRLAREATAGAKALKERFSPRVPAASPCVPCLDKEPGAVRIARMKRRQELIAKGQASPDPDTQAAAKLLKDDMKAVELGKLSANTYEQYDPSVVGPAKAPPEPWKALTESEVKGLGLRPSDLSAAKAVVYQAPPDFPFEPKTVVAFRGTTADKEDILADHDQALGKQMRENGIEAEVTGHSLGGGKAQACGVAGGYGGQMFNSAGLHPDTVGKSPADLKGEARRFLQYRAEGGISKGFGDPLTFTQNSMAAQKTALGVATATKGWLNANEWAGRQTGLDPLGWAQGQLPKSVQDLAGDLTRRVMNVTLPEAKRNFALSGGQWYIPPALGEVRGLTSKNPDGSDSALAAQHSILRLNDGFEHRKAATIGTLLSQTGTPGSLGQYIGPMR